MYLEAHNEFYTMKNEKQVKMLLKTSVQIEILNQSHSVYILV